MNVTHSSSKRTHGFNEASYSYLDRAIYPDIKGITKGSNFCVESLI